MRNSEAMDIIDVKGSDLAGDPREWLTKALTEEDADKPGPRNTITGNSKRKHQVITILMFIFKVS